MRFHLAPSLKKGFFRTAVNETCLKLRGEENSDFDLVVYETEDQLDAVKLYIPDANRKEIIKIAKATNTSISVKKKDNEVIFIRLDTPALKESKLAFKGLLAHELGHTILRKTGLEKKIEEESFRQLPLLLQELDQFGATPKKRQQWAIDIMQNAILSLKDVDDNLTLIQRGFRRELQTYYLHVFKNEKQDFVRISLPSPVCKTLPEVVQLIMWELQLIAIWLPFERKNTVNQLHDTISKYYESDIHLLALTMHELKDTCKLWNKNRTSFYTAWFEKVRSVVIHVMKRSSKC